MTQVSLVPILLWVAALAAAGIAIWRGPRPITRGFVVDRLLRYLFLFPLGLQGPIRDYRDALSNLGREARSRNATVSAGRRLPLCRPS